MTPSTCWLTLVSELVKCLSRFNPFCCSGLCLPYSFEPSAFWPKKAQNITAIFIKCHLLRLHPLLQLVKMLLNPDSVIPCISYLSELVVSPRLDNRPPLSSSNSMINCTKGPSQGQSHWQASKLRLLCGSDFMQLFEYPLSHIKILPWLSLICEDILTPALPSSLTLSDPLILALIALPARLALFLSCIGAELPSISELLWFQSLYLNYSSLRYLQLTLILFRS